MEEYNIDLRHPNTTAFDFPIESEFGFFNETGLYGHFQVSLIILNNQFLLIKLINLKSILFKYNNMNYNYIIINKLIIGMKI